MALARTTITVYPAGSGVARFAAVPAAVSYRAHKSTVRGVIRVPPSVGPVEEGDAIVDDRTGYRYAVTSVLIPHAPGLWRKILGTRVDALVVEDYPTTITVLAWTQEELDAEPYTGAEPSQVKSEGVRALISEPTRGRAGARMAGGEQEKVAFPFRAESTDVGYLDWIRDERTDVVYQVEWVAQSDGASVGELSIVKGGV